MLTREAFRDMCQKSVVLLDGATGTNLMEAGMTMGCCPEQWILDHPQVILDLQSAYVAAGSKIVLAPTFTTNRIKLEEYGLGQRVEEINEKLVALTKNAVGDQAYVAADMTMTGQQLAPMGKMKFEEFVDVYKEQVRALLRAGVDLFMVETMMSLNECRAALLAIRECCDLPVMITLSFNEDGLTLFGTDGAAAVVALQALGADAVGVNCSAGPDQMRDVIVSMRDYAKIPIIAKPNAGMPELVNGKSVYTMSPETFAREMKVLCDLGAGILGGCCGTTPEHISTLKEVCGNLPVPSPEPKIKRVLSSERRALSIDLDRRFMVIGERINPTGKKKLQAALREQQMDYVLELALNQEAKGADILDINMGMNGIDEKEMMLKTVEMVSSAVNLPLCIDSSHVDVIEAALRIYPGRALINSISFEKEKLEKLLPIAQKYGAMFILLPLSDEGLPKDLEEKHEIIRQISEKAYAMGFEAEDIIVDGLVATIGANKKAALETLATIAYCHDTLGLATTCGLSNISFGLPERTCVNTAFLTMAISKGLTMAIANPSQEMLMDAAFATDLLMNKECSDERYIAHMNQKNQVQQTQLTAEKKPEKQATVMEQIYDAVLKGSRDAVIPLCEAGLKDGFSADDLIQKALIPAIQKVGDLFEKQTYFLPQLIASAETMEKGILLLEPYLVREDAEKKATVVIATVEGDIHDIGKNLVVLMLKNYGFNVIDLGKDVSAKLIVETAIKEHAEIIGLSALMTTTMMRMGEVVAEAKALGCTSKIMIGGAVITESFAEEIGADGYSKDAADAVRLAEELIST